MDGHRDSERRVFLSRSEVELELARIALVVMRAAPGSYAELTGNGRLDGEDALPTMCASLLARTAPEHQPFVQGRLLELARSLAGGRVDAGLSWMSPEPVTGD